MKMEENEKLAENGVKWRQNDENGRKLRKNAENGVKWSQKMMKIWENEENDEWEKIKKK